MSITTNETGYVMGFPFACFRWGSKNTQKKQNNSISLYDEGYKDGFEKGFAVAYDRLEKEIQDLREYIQNVQIVNVISEVDKL